MQRMKNSFILIILGLFFLSVKSVSASYPQNIPKRFTAKIEIRVDLTQKGADKETKLWLPYPVSTNYQKISDISIRGSYDYMAIYSDAHGNDILFARWNEKTKEKKIYFSFLVTRRERVEHPPSSTTNCPNPLKETGPYLNLKALAAIPPQLATLSATITQNCKTPLEKARAIFSWVTRNLKRDPRVQGCGSGDVCYVLERKAGKCADIHSVFVALLRAVNIPAREVYGLRLDAARKEADITTWQHCWAEFYLPGYGWHASDPADYLKALLEKNLNHDSPLAKEIWQYYWSRLDPFRVRLVTGRITKLNPPQSSAPLPYFMYPYAEVENEPVNPFDATNFHYSIRMKGVK